MPLRRAAACALGLVAGLAAFSAGAAGRYCVVDGWGTGEGLLPQNAVISMVQTRDGYLWLGTQNGLARFDGVHFTVFDQSTTPKLSSIQTVKLFEDSQSNLWIGTESGGAMMVTNGQILPLDFGPGRSNRLASLCEDSTGAVWMLAHDRKLARFWRGTVDIWTIPGSDLTDGRAVVAEKSGFVWAGTDSSLIGIDPTAVKTKGELPAGIHMPVGKLDYLLASRSGGYWRLSDRSITKWNGTHLEQNLGAYPWPVGLAGNVLTACEDRAGNLIVGTYNQGVYWFDAHGGYNRICTTNGLANDSVLSLVMDADGSLWVGMDGGGPSGHPLNRVTRSIFNLLEDSAGKQIQSISEDKGGGLWYSPKNENFRYWSNGISAEVGSLYGSMQFYNPRAVLVDSQERVWGATLGINLLLLSGGQFRLAPGVAPLNPDVSALYEGHDGRIWAGTQGGLECWDGNHWQTLTTSNGLSSDAIRAIAEGTNGDLWVGTDGGLDRVREGRVTVFQKASGFPSDDISCLCPDADGVLWVGTVGNGLLRLAGDQWKHYTSQSGLTGNSIDYIIEDGAGYLWIGSNDGLMRVGKKELADFDPGRPGFLACRGYDEKDGLPANECTFGSQPAACRTRAGLLWFPTIAGMVSVDPSEIHPNTNPPPVVIEEVLVDEEPQNTNGFRAELPPESVTVPAGRENLEIQYTSLNLAAAARTLFRCQLEGYQSVANVTGDRFARYLNLPHGNYRFQVQARNEDGVWNEVGASLEVIVLPPFWETGWFRFVAVAAFWASSSRAVHFISTQKLQRQLAGLRQQQALEKERARIARDIHDQVGASLTQLSILGEMVQADKDSPQEAETHARQISQTARETARELDEIVWTVNPSNDTLDGLVNYICKNAQEYLAVAGLRYRLDVPAQLPAAAISPEARHNVFLAAKEAVTNVVRHARATEAWLRLRLGSAKFYPGN